MTVIISHYLMCAVFAQLVHINICNINSCFAGCLKNAHITHSRFIPEPCNTIENCGMSVAVRVSGRDSLASIVFSFKICYTIYIMN